MEHLKTHNIHLNSISQDGLRAPEANEMLERTPSRFLRWGAWSVITIFGILLFIGTFVKYPDTLEGAATITTDPLPIKMKAPIGGRITRLFQGDASNIQKGDVIAEMENVTGYDNIRQLETIIDRVTSCLATNNTVALGALTRNPLQSLGEAQGYYNQLLQQVSAKLLLQKEQLYKKRAENISGKIAKYQTLTAISTEEKAMIEEELKQADERFEANEKLYKKKLISREEYYDESARLRQKKLLLDQQKANIMQNNLNSGENNKQLMELQYEHEGKDLAMNVGIEESLRNILNYIQSWKQRYLIVAPYAGTLVYLRPLQVNEPAETGEELFTIVPLVHKFEAIVILPSAGIGKIAVEQKVHIMLDNYPYNEYGYVEGKIAKRSALPEIVRNASGAHSIYRVYVQLPDTLVTNYHKPITFTPEMTATARIITKDRNLLHRLVAGIAKTTDK